MPDGNDRMGEYSAPKTSMGPRGPMGPRMPGRRGMVFTSRSEMMGKGAGWSPYYDRFIESPFSGTRIYQKSKTFEETYKETYELVKRKHKWFSKPLLGIWAGLSAIPRHILRHSISDTTYSPSHVASMEAKYKNKL